MQRRVSYRISTRLACVERHAFHGGLKPSGSVWQLPRPIQWCLGGFREHAFEAARNTSRSVSPFSESDSANDSRVSKAYAVLRIFVKEGNNEASFFSEKHVLTLREILDVAKKKQARVGAVSGRGKRELLQARDVSRLSLTPRHDYPAVFRNTRVSFSAALAPAYHTLTHKFAGKAGHVVFGIEHLHDFSKSSDQTMGETIALCDTSARLSVHSADDTKSSLREKAIRFAQHRRLAPQLVVRGDCVIIAFSNIRCVMWNDEALIFDADMDVVSSFVQDYLMPSLQSRVKQKCSPGEVNSPDNEVGQQNDELNDASRVETDFDFVLLDAILDGVCDSWERRLLFYHPLVVNLLKKLNQDTDGYASAAEFSVARLLPVKNSLSHFELQLRECVACIEELLASDDDMVSMLVSERARSEKQYLDTSLHTVVELMLEEHKRRLNTILTETLYLQGKIQSKQELAKLSMDAYRNRILSISLNLSVAALSLAFPTVMAGIMGMNLVSGLESSPTAFFSIVAGSSFLGAAVAGGTLAHIQGRSLGHKQFYQHRVNELKAYSKVLSDLESLDRTVRQVLRETGVNSTGVISEERVKVLFSEASGRAISHDEMRLIISTFDEDGSGSIEREELEYFSTKKKSKTLD